MEQTEQTEFILVTGAGGGMGSAAVKAFADRGFTVFALDRNPPEGSERIIPITADVTDENSLISAAGIVKNRTDRLFAVVHYAGIYMLDSLVEMESSGFEKIMRVNLSGAFLVNRTFLPFLSDGSRIVIVTSELADIDPLPFTGIYAVSKCALDRYAFSLRMELQLLGISVSVIRAGAVGTGMLAASTDALERFCKKTKLYSCNARRFRKIVDSVEAKSVPPEKIAEKTLSILGSRHPRFAYGVNRNFLLRLYAVCPAKVKFWAVGRILAGK